MEILTIQLRKREFKNEDSANNLIRYITRTRLNEDKRADLITYGFPYGNNFSKPIEQVVREFEYIQQAYNTTGSLMCHYCIHIPSDSLIVQNNDLEKLNEYAQECCNYVFNLGHQCVYAIHYSPKEKLHIHLAINTTNYMTGHKLRQYYKEAKAFIERPLSEIFKKYNCCTACSIYDM